MFRAKVGQNWIPNFHFSWFILNIDIPICGPPKSLTLTHTSMAMTQEPIDWRYLPYMMPIFSEYHHKIWPEICYSSSIKMDPENPTDCPGYYFHDILLHSII